MGTLQGSRTYRVCPARPQEISAIKLESHWMAVLPRDCQPGDCGKEVPVLRFEIPIGPGGIEFCMAIIEGEGHIRPLTSNAVRVHTPAADYVVLYSDEGPVQADGVVSDAECVRLVAGAPDVAWLVNGTRISIHGKPWSDRSERFSGELAP